MSCGNKYAVDLESSDIDAENRFQH